jgi:hypothetical protein
MLPLFAYFPMGLNINSVNLALAGIPKQESTTSSSFKINRTQEHEITDAIDKRIHLNRESSPFFCNVVDNLIACSLSKAKSPNSIMPVE